MVHTTWDPSVRGYKDRSVSLTLNINKTDPRPMRIRGVVALCLLACSQALCAAPADDVQALLEKGDAAGAYELGRKHRDQLGNPAFDFYFGIAAINAGHSGEGVLALERYVLT